MKICDKCGWENEDGFNFCLGCGTPLEKAAPSGEGKAPADDRDSGVLRQDIASGSHTDDDWWDKQMKVETGNTPEREEPAVSLGEEEEKWQPPPPPGADWRSTAEPSASKDDAADSPRVESNLLEFSPQEKLCDSCGNKVPIDNKFCGHCGALVSKSGASPEKSTPVRAPGKLILLLPDGTDGGTYPLRSGETVVGRTQGNIRFVDDNFISPRHAVFSVEGDDVIVGDNSSINGLFLKLRDETELQDGDCLLLGKQLLQLEILRRAEPDEEIDIELADDDPPPIWGSPHGDYWGKLTQLVTGGSRGNSVLLAGEETDIGREQGDITFPGDGFISASHLRISYRDGDVFARDLGSRNGTFLRIREDSQLKTDDILIIGEQLLRVELS